MKKKLNQSGQASAEFLFSLIIAFGLFILFFSISFTLTVVEVGQYIAFSTSRAQVGGNKNQAAQREAATNKYQSFSSLPAFGLLFKSGWFVFAKNPDIRQGGSNSQDNFRDKLGDGGSGATPPFEQVYTGVSIPFQSKILGMQVPFLNPASTEDAGFSTNINAILIREPTQEECYRYWGAARAQALKNLPSGAALPAGGGYDPSAYVMMEDAGC